MELLVKVLIFEMFLRNYFIQDILVKNFSQSIKPEKKI